MSMSAVHRKKTFDALLTELSRAFDYLSHGLLITKINPYRLSFEALRKVQDYLSNGKQRAKINSTLIHERTFYKFMRGNFI